MDLPCIALPVKCPECGIVDLVQFPMIVVVTAMTLWNQMRLSATCHEISWDASASEIQAIREHVGVMWLESARQRLSEGHVAERVNA